MHTWVTNIFQMNILSGKMIKSSAIHFLPFNINLISHSVPLQTTKIKSSRRIILGISFHWNKQKWSLVSHCEKFLRHFSSSFFFLLYFCVRFNFSYDYCEGAYGNVRHSLIFSVGFSIIMIECVETWKWWSHSYSTELQPKYSNMLIAQCTLHTGVHRFLCFVRLMQLMSRGVHIQNCAGKNDFIEMPAISY